ncbi:MAG: DUF423 domain-containing protein [Alphaproteobacteria bacterium]|nr:DUF423 domain-containing protein [Alphaproteobacteria bacterium]
MNKTQIFIGLAGLNGLLATALAAIGSHALPHRVSAADKAMFAMAAQFHLFHALALLGVGALAYHRPAKSLTFSAAMFQTGILAFSGSLYIRAVMGPGSLGAFHWITPLGGLAFMAGWAGLIALAFRRAD